MTKEEAAKELEEEFKIFLEGSGLDNEEYLEEEMKNNEDLRKVVEAYSMAVAALSGDVRPNIHGHWIKINSGDEDFPESIVCDRCNHENSHLDFNEHNEPIGKVFVTSNFCPNCGADMREPKGEKRET